MKREELMSAITTLLDESRKKLLDLTLRNTLLNYNLKRKSRLIIVDELPDVLYAQLLDGKKMNIDAVPYPDVDEESPLLEELKKFTFSSEEQPFCLLDYSYYVTVIVAGVKALEEVDKASGFVNARSHAKKLGIEVKEEAPLFEADEALESKHTDNAIQTLHYADALEKMMRKRRAEANTAIQETGSNLLYLAIGFLKWKQSVHSDRELHAPLILIPVEIVKGSPDKTTGVYTYTIEYTDDEMFSNISLIYKMRQEFGIEIPEFKEEETPEAYFSKINEICENRNELLGVSRRFALDFFHFSKLLMYLDLESSNWPKERPIEENALLSEISGESSVDGGKSTFTEIAVDETEKMGLVMDADSSQRDAIAQVMHGHNLIIEGPPGTGKSQTIANLIAVALSEGKSVLFVAEKLVALEVVKKRLDAVGLGHFILELHSHKSNKASVYCALKERVDLELPSYTSKLNDTISEQEKIKTNIQDYLNLLHTNYEYVEQTPYTVFGEVQNRYEELIDTLPVSENFLNINFSMLKEIEIQLNALEKLIAEDATALHSVWKGFTATNAIMLDADNIVILFEALKEQYEKLDSVFAEDAMLEGLAPTEDTFLMLKEIEEKELLSQCPSLDMLKRVEDFDLENFEELVKKSDLLVSKATRFEALDLEALENIDALSSLSRTLRGHKDIGFLGKWFNSDYKEARKKFNILVLKETKNDAMIMSKVLDNYKTMIRQYFRDLKHFYDAGGEKLLSILQKKIVNVKQLQNFSDTLDGLKSIIELKSIVEWKSKMITLGFPAGLLGHFASTKQQNYIGALQNSASKYETIQNKTDTVLAKINRYGELSENQFFMDKSIIQERIKILSDKLEHQNELPLWIDVSRMLGVIQKMELDYVLFYAREKGLESRLKELFFYGYYREWSHKILRENDVLAKFNRHTFEAHLKQYRNLDSNLGALYAKEHALVLSASSVPEGKGGRVADKTEMQLIRNEIHKQKRHIPIRQLLKRSPKALRALKPCFMMSPLSVAQFIDPEQEPFDLIVMDEASQIFPEDALGAMARAKQVVVVGDPNQLPPTSFFSSSIHEEDTEETVATTAESILDLMLRVYPGVKRLKWHYRSQHESLIAFSNYHFYDSELMIFPSPNSHSEHVGIKRIFIEDGFYKQQQNMKEAVRIVDAVCTHFLDGSKDSLGVVAMNKKQAGIIDQLLEEKTKENQHIRHLIDDAYKSGNLFIKNLENVQGDEADTLYIGTTYGPDHETKKVYQRFGPINGEHGWRRMNVLVTRARKKIVVFTSMVSNDILASEGNRGRMALKNYLHYIEEGKVEKQVGITTGKEPDSPFEESVIRYVESLGFVAKPQVGVAGFFIDIGVMVEGSYNYILGIECDGATYHSTNSARDRDRIRQEILESMGWEIYRIWSTDWFKNRKNEEERLQKRLLEVKSKALMLEVEPEEEVEVPENRGVEEEVDMEDDASTEETAKAENELKTNLLNFRDKYIKVKYEIDTRSILSDRMIDLFVNNKPTTMDEFRLYIPQYLREKLDREQMEFMDDIFGVIESSV